ncbi:carboxypeptidase-like regulatory domain-containing protein [Nostoc sp.]|uniref:carboxypeptidase-like regulatory domain-containing protein n=1 Tax=Nostoc sp. TaxID=1180 RepID=UPI002FFB52CD
MPNHIKTLKYKWELILITSIFLLAIEGCTFQPNTKIAPNSDNQTANQIQTVEFITETESGEPLKDVNIIVNGLGAPESTYSDKNGYANIKIPNEGDVRINLNKEGYESQTITVNIKNLQSINRRYRLKTIDKSGSNILSDYKNRKSSNPEPESTTTSPPQNPVQTFPKLSINASLTLQRRIINQFKE